MLTKSQFLTNADVNFAFDGSLVQWSEVPVVPGVGICSVLQQDGYHLSMTKGTGIVKGNQSTFVREEREGEKGEWEGGREGGREGREGKEGGGGGGKGVVRNRTVWGWGETFLSNNWHIRTCVCKSVQEQPVREYPVQHMLPRQVCITALLVWNAPPRHSDTYRHLECPL